MNTELVNKALDKVGNPNVLVNLISRRVRQLATGGGASRPLVADTGRMGAADVALLELTEDKMGWEFVQEVEKPEATEKRRRRS